MDVSYIIKRLFLTFLSIIGVITIVFIILRMIPGDPVVVMLGGYGTWEEMEAARKFLGLDQPIYVQYFRYLQRLFLGDWGYSITAGVIGAEPVLPLVLRKFFASLQLALTSTILAAIVGIILGILSAARRGRTDKIFRIISLLGFSMPVFWTGMIFVLVFSLRLRLFPSIGGGGPQHLVLPTLTLTVYLFGIFTRVTRAAALDVIHQDFVFIARAKGLKERRILISHILRNSLIPVVTVGTLQFGSLVGGAVITETVFNYPGLGSLIVQSLYKRDYPVVQGGMLLVAIVIALVNLISDFLYMYLDPRIRYTKRV